MQHPNDTHRRGPRRSASTGVLAYAALLLGIGVGLATPAAAHAQQRAAQGNAARPAANPLTPADSLACIQVINYAFAHSEVLQQGQKLQSNPKAMALLAAPDSVRTQVAAAVAKGQGDSLKAIARRVVGEETAAAYDGFVDLVAAFPDSIRSALATLVTHGRLLNCAN